MRTTLSAAKGSLLIEVKYEPHADPPWHVALTSPPDGMVAGGGGNSLEECAKRLARDHDELCTLFPPENDGDRSQEHEERALIAAFRAQVVPVTLIPCPVATPAAEESGG